MADLQTSPVLTCEWCGRAADGIYVDGYAYCDRHTGERAGEDRTRSEALRVAIAAARDGLPEELVREILTDELKVSPVMGDEDIDWPDVFADGEGS